MTDDATTEEVRPLREVVRNTITDALRKCGSVRAAAKALRISRSTIHRRLAQFRREAEEQQQQEQGE